MLNRLLVDNSFMSENNKRSNILLESGTNEVEFLQFKLGNLNCGINVSKVSQVVQFRSETITRLPSNAKSIIGTYFYQDEAINVVDLSSYLDIKYKEENTKSLLLITEFNKTKIGFKIEDVNQIHRLSWEEFTPYTDSNGITGSDCIVGTVNVASEIVLILDFEVILSEINPSRSIETFMGEVGEASSEKDLKIVLCEDSKIIRSIIEQSLNKGGYSNIKYFENGQEGYNYLKDVGVDEVDLIISDIEMPRMDGLALCKSVRSNSNFKDIPFLFFSSLINDEMRRKCSKVGGTACFSKPEINELVEKINEY